MGKRTEQKAGVTFSVFFLSICDLSECMEVLFRPVIF